MGCRTPGFAVIHYLLEFAQNHVHWVGRESNQLILYHPLLLPLIFPSIRVISNESALLFRWPKYWSISFSITVLLTNIQGWFPLGWLIWSPYCPRDSQETSPAPQFKNISSSALSLFYVPTLISVHDCWKNHRCD